MYIGRTASIITFLTDRPCVGALLRSHAPLRKSLTPKKRPVSNPRASTTHRPSHFSTNGLRCDIKRWLKVRLLNFSEKRSCVHFTQRLPGMPWWKQRQVQKNAKVGLKLLYVANWQGLCKGVFTVAPKRPLALVLYT